MYVAAPKRLDQIHRRQNFGPVPASLRPTCMLPQANTELPQTPRPHHRNVSTINERIPGTGINRNNDCNSLSTLHSCSKNLTEANKTNPACRITGRKRPCAACARCSSSQAEPADKDLDYLEAARLRSLVVLFSSAAPWSCPTHCSTSMVVIVPSSTRD